MSKRFKIHLYLDVLLNRDERTRTRRERTRTHTNTDFFKIIEHERTRTQIFSKLSNTNEHEHWAWKVTEQRTRDRTPNTCPNTEHVTEHNTRGIIPFITCSYLRTVCYYSDFADFFVNILLFLGLCGLFRQYFVITRTSRTVSPIFY